MSLAMPAHRPAPWSADSLAGKALLAAYLATVLWSVARLWNSYRRTRSTVTAALETVLPRTVVSDVAERLKIPLPSIRSSALPLAPFTFGFRRPVIVLPEEMLASGPSDVLLSVIGHEMAHIERGDFLCQAALELLFPLLAFHPCAHWIRRRIRAARELSCDELVAARFLDGPRYAASLLDVALKTAACAPLASPALSTVSAGDLEDRIRRLMVAERGTPPRLAWRAALVAAAALVTVGIGVAYSFQPADPRDYTGVWRQNWASAFRPELQVDRNDCCFQTLEIQYRDGRFQGTITAESAGVEGNRVTRGPTNIRAIEDAKLEDGILTFHQSTRSQPEIYEVTLGPNGSALVRSHAVPPVVRHWTVYARVR
jgi:beta-lactamase regulating signal transducer with metallopeptidase domain